MPTTTGFSHAHRNLNSNSKGDETSGALVMAADYRALGVARSLGRRGIPAWILKQGGHLVASFSRYVQRNISWPAADDRTEISLLLELATKYKLQNWLLFPTDDHAVALISRHHKVLSRAFKVTVPPWEHLRFACDKRVLHETARKLGIRQPWTAWPRTRGEISVLDCPFPVILKPATRFRPNTLAIPKAWRADDQLSLLTRYDEASAVVGGNNLIVQEILPSGGETQFSYGALCRDGFVLASVMARENRQYPMDFGQFSTYVETVDEPQVAESSERLLAATRFTGLIELEFKKDPRDGSFKILDINPRVWGWHTLARRVGVDFPYLLWLLIEGQDVPRLRGRSGARWFHRSGDIPAAMQQIASGRLSLRDYVRSLKGPAESALFAWDDPLPGWLDVPLLGGAIVKRFLAPRLSIPRIRSGEKHPSDHPVHDVESFGAASSASLDNVDGSRPPSKYVPPQLGAAASSDDIVDPG